MRVLDQRLALIRPSGTFSRKREKDLHAAELAAFGCSGDRLQALGAGSSLDFLRPHDPLHEEEDDHGDDEEIEDGSEEVTVEDRVLTAENEFGVSPLPARHQKPDDRHQDVVNDGTDELAGGGADDHADGQRKRVRLGEE